MSQESQNLEWKEAWKDDHLPGPHSSRSYNPVVANAFFRAGEIEAWGRGIQRIFDACATANTPEPKLTLHGSDVCVEFPFSEAYLSAVETNNHSETIPDGTPKASGKSSGKSPTVLDRPKFHLSINGSGHRLRFLQAILRKV